MENTSVLFKKLSEEMQTIGANVVMELA